MPGVRDQPVQYRRDPVSTTTTTTATIHTHTHIFVHSFKDFGWTNETVFCALMWKDLQYI